MPVLLRVLYEDDDCFAILKPSGMPSVTLRLGESETAVARAALQFPEILKVGDNPLELSILHRLDTGTSGVLLFAKNQEAYAHLKLLWKAHKIQKFYTALVSEGGTTLPAQITIPIGNSAKTSKRMIALTDSMRERQIRGRPLSAVTRILSQTPSPSPHHPRAIRVEIEIETGVRHQIRVHLSALGCPILGDTVYGGATAPRLMLHACRLVIPTRAGKLICIESAAEF